MKTRFLARIVSLVGLGTLAVSVPTGCAVVGLVAAAHPVLAIGAGALLVGLDQTRPRGGAVAPDDELAPGPDVAGFTSALNLTPEQARQIIPLLAETEKARQAALASRAKFATHNTSFLMDVWSALTEPQKLQFAQMLADGGGVLPQIQFSPR